MGWNGEDGPMQESMILSLADRMNKHMIQMWNGDYDHCGGVSGNEAGFRWHGMDW